MPGLRSGKLRLESRLEANLAARLGKHELALRRCLTRPQSGDAKKPDAATAAEKAPRKTPRRKGSNWIDDFDLKKSLPVWQPAQACGARRDDSPAELRASGRPTKTSLGAPGKRRPAVVALSEPKASAPRLHQTDPAQEHSSGWERAAWEGSIHSEPDSQRVRASHSEGGGLFVTRSAAGRDRRV